MIPCTYSQDQAIAIALGLARRVGFVIVYLPKSMRLTLFLGLRFRELDEPWSQDMIMIMPCNLTDLGVSEDPPKPRLAAARTRTGPELPFAVEWRLSSRTPRFKRSAALQRCVMPAQTIPVQGDAA